MKKYLLVLLFSLIVLLLGIRFFVPAFVEKGQNSVKKHNSYAISDRARKLHESLSIVDWHSDSLLWDRDLTKEHYYGHVDFPRLRKGNVALQIFTTVTKSPVGQNVHKNAMNAPDNITYLSLLQTWPISTWASLKARALFQGERLKGFIKKDALGVHWVKSKKDLAEGLAKRKSDKNLLLVMTGIEGAHALDGKIQSIKELKKAGFTIFGLQHFFDNQLGGSLHGIKKRGLTPFGKRAVGEIIKNNLIIDVSHSSEAVVKEILKNSSRPVVMSHTGIKGICPTERNISEKLMKQITRQGGLIAIGFWSKAICDISPRGIVKAIRYGIDKFGVDHIALGSDFDGAVRTALDASELAVLTHTMLEEGMSEMEIRKVMGENSLRFLKQYLPD